HSYSGLVLYPWGFRAGQLPPDLPRFEALAGTDLVPAVPDSVPGSTLDHYHPGPGWNLYTTNGEYTDWAYRAYGTIAFTTELTSGCCVNGVRSEEHTSELQSRSDLVCRLLLEKK